jgi:hypothetical protein
MTKRSNKAWGLQACKSNTEFMLLLLLLLVVVMPDN